MVRRCRSKECSPLNTPHRVVFAIGVTEGVGSVRELSLEWSGKYPGAVFPACGAIVRSREWIDSEQAFTRESGGAYRGSQGVAYVCNWFRTSRVRLSRVKVTLVCANVQLRVRRATTRVCVGRGTRFDNG